MCVCKPRAKEKRTVKIHKTRGPNQSKWGTASARPSRPPSRHAAVARSRHPSNVFRNDEHSIHMARVTCFFLDNKNPNRTLVTLLSRCNNRTSIFSAFNFHRCPPLSLYMIHQIIYAYISFLFISFFSSERLRKPRCQQQQLVVSGVDRAILHALLI